MCCGVGISPPQYWRNRRNRRNPIFGGFGGFANIRAVLEFPRHPKNGETAETAETPFGGFGCTAPFDQTAVIPSDRVQIWGRLFLHGWYCPGVRLQIWVCLICVISPYSNGAVQIRLWVWSSLNRGREASGAEIPEKWDNNILCSSCNGSCLWR